MHRVEEQFLRLDQVPVEVEAEAENHGCLSDKILVVAIDCVVFQERLIQMAPAQEALATQQVGVIEIELAGGTRVRITGAVDAAAVSAAVAALMAKERRS